MVTGNCDTQIGPNKLNATEGGEMSKKPKPKDEGLVGFFGHTLIDKDGEKTIQYQFRIIRPLPPDRWVVQYFSFMDSGPTNLAVYPESFLLGPDVKLYANQENWRCDRERWRREALKARA